MGQNLFLEEEFIVIEEHKLSGFTKDDSLIASTSGSWMPQYYKYTNIHELSIADNLWTQIGDGKLILYKFPFELLGDATYDITSLTEEADIERSYNIEDGILTGIDHHIRSFFTIDQWGLSHDDFRIEKRTVAIAPVGNFPKKIDANLSNKKFDRIVIGMIKYPEKLHKKYNRKKIHRNFVLVKELSYEFNMLDVAWLKRLDMDYPYWDYDLPSPFFLANSIQWNESSWKLIIDRIFEQLASEQTYEYESESKLDPDLESIHSKIFNDKYPARYWTGISGRDSEEGQKAKWIQADLKERCFSLIFHEKWYLDPETMYLKKEVVSLSPVYWKIIDENTEDSIRQTQDIRPEYDRLPLFTVAFEERER